MSDIINKLNLGVPICFLDLETTGLNTSRDRIVEISIIKIGVTGIRTTYYAMLNPEISIPFEASVIHGIYDEDVADKETFSEKALEIKDFIGDSALGGFNSNVFDLPLLVAEFGRTGVFFDYFNRVKIDVRNIHVRNNKNDLRTLYKQYMGRDLVNAHAAEADNSATIEIFERQLTLYPELYNVDLNLYSNYDKELIDFKGKFVMKDGDIYYNFGKNKGLKATEDKPYLNWIVFQSEMDEDVKTIARALLKK